MVTLLILIQLLLVFTLIFIGARIGGIGMGIYGMVGVFLLVFVFGLKPGNIPIDVMLIIVSVITLRPLFKRQVGWIISCIWRPNSCENIPNTSPIMGHWLRGFSV